MWCLTYAIVALPGVQVWSRRLVPVCKALSTAGDCYSELQLSTMLPASIMNPEHHRSRHRLRIGPRIFIEAHVTPVPISLIIFGASFSNGIWIRENRSEVVMGENATP